MIGKPSLLAPVLFATVLAFLPAHAHAAPAVGLSKLPADRPIVMGYVNALRSASGFEQTLSPAQVVTEIKGLHWAGYDAVIHAFAEPIDSNGSIGESLGNFKIYQSTLITEAHARNKSVILSIGGAFPTRLQDQFLAIATNDTKRETFVSNIVTYLKTNGYDGVDIDWEFPNATNGKAALTQLMIDLYGAVKAEDPDYIVMFGTGPAYYMGGYDFATLKNYADFFFYFGYDWKGASPSGANGPIKQPNSGPQWTTANDTLYEKSVRGGIQYVIDKGFPANKIICGLPFYGSNNVSWSSVRNTWAADKATFDAAIDPDAMEVKINNAWFTSPKAMKMKMDALLKTSSSVLNDNPTIRGVGTWEIGHEHRSNPDLSTAFEEWITEFSGNPVLPKISIADASLGEGDSGSSSLTLTVTMDRTSSAEVTVEYDTRDETATSGSDYKSTSGTLRFASGETSKTITLTIIGDTTFESDETFSVTLSNPNGAALEKSTATVTIVNDDASPPTNQPGWVRHYQTSSGVSVSFVPPTGPAVWSSGFSGKIEVTNNGSRLDEWTLAFDAPWTTTGSGNAGSWNISNQRHAVTQPTWGGYSVASGAKITLDFVGNGVWSEPTNLEFNGDGTAPGNEDNIPLSSWQNTHEITDITDDSNRNGLPDLVDFLLGNNPSTGSGDPEPLQAKLQDLTVDGQSNTYFCVELTVDTKAEGVEYRIELSEDLSSWTAGTSVMVLHETNANPDGSTKAIWRSASPVSEGDTKKFARLVAREII
ncbi:MAG: glycosyl hydrolase family 18 protein [Verrucomicrobiota bacterium]